MTGRGRGPTDRERRNRIARAALRVALAEGVAGLTHRAVAGEAGVPLGSTTYYFKSRHELVRAAAEIEMASFETLVAEWERRNRETPIAGALGELAAQLTATEEARQHMLVAYELYVDTARTGVHRQLSTAWDEVLAQRIRRRLPEGPARLAYAALNGLVLDAVVGGRSLLAEDVAALLRD